jgi:hypothetical protein
VSTFPDHAFKARVKAVRRPCASSTGGRDGHELLRMMTSDNG